tara:strand:+ start:1223 stop:1747 length:525 start_codon:yes stop_codon:yes gene_type:complete
MKIYNTKFKDLIILKSKNFEDSRGLLREVILEKFLKKKLIFSLISKSKKHVLRGLHMQTKKMQGKYVSVIKGKVLDVAVDCRKKSKTFGKHYKIILSEKNATSVYIPPGFAHGFLALGKENIVLYSCTNYRNKESEISISWNDKDIKIKWPINKPILSKRDSNNKSFKKLNFTK